jgi:hypothetical protein
MLYCNPIYYLWLAIRAQTGIRQLLGRPWHSAPTTPNPGHDAGDLLTAPRPVPALGSRLPPAIALAQHQRRRSCFGFQPSFVARRP